MKFSRMGRCFLPLLTACLLLTASCGTAPAEPAGQQAPPSSTPESSAPSSGPEQEQRETLRVGQIGTGIKSAMVVLAHELGLYEQEGLDVEFVDISNLNDGIVAINTGKMEVLPFGVIPTCTFYAQGADLTIFGGTIAEGSQAVCLPENLETFQSLDGFRGKTVACVRPETGHMLMKAALREHGLEPGADVTFVELDGFQSVVEAVRKGEADVGFTNSGFGQNAQKQGLSIAFDVAQYAPNAVCCRQTASATAVEQNPEAYIRFQTANLEAYKRYLEDPDLVVDTLTAYSGLEREYVYNCMYDGVMKVTMDPMKKRVAEFYDAMKANGDIDEAAPGIDGGVNTEIYDAALTRMEERYPGDEGLAELRRAFEENN